MLRLGSESGCCLNQLQPTAASYPTPPPDGDIELLSR
jgi:hypothetical protein